jgi:hypothetical protein
LNVSKSGVDASFSKAISKTAIFFSTLLTNYWKFMAEKIKQERNIFIVLILRTILYWPFKSVQAILFLCLQKRNFHWFLNISYSGLILANLQPRRKFCKTFYVTTNSWKNWKMCAWEEKISMSVKLLQLSVLPKTANSLIWYLLQHRPAAACC